MIFFYFKLLLPAKIQVLHNIGFSSEKLSESEEKYAPIKQRQSSKQIYMSGFWCEKTTVDGNISLEEGSLWIMDWYFGQKQ